MPLDVDAGVSRDVFYPIANAMYVMVHPDGELKDLPGPAQEPWYERAVAAFCETLSMFDPRARYNIQLVAQVRRLPDAAIMALTQHAPKTSVESRRALIVRALRIEAPR